MSIFCSLPEVVLKHAISKEISQMKEVRKNETAVLCLRRRKILMKQKKIYAADLEIDLSSKQETEYFKWFLACLFFGKPIQQEVAKKTYIEFVKEGLITPDALLQAGWDRLVDVLDRGHYVRYDFSTATKLLTIAKTLKEKYGTLTYLLQQSHSIDELSSRLQEFQGIGPKTAEIFLRDIIPLFPPNTREQNRQQRE